MTDVKDTLLAAARRSMEAAYAPYSRFRVGAALFTSGGKVFSGCNVENASYGLTVCAERSAVFQMVAAGEREIAAILVIGDTDEFLPPCGACRQVLAEFAKPETPVYMCTRGGESRLTSIRELLPFRFSLKT